MSKLASSLLRLRPGRRAMTPWLPAAPASATFTEHRTHRRKPSCRC